MNKRDKKHNLKKKRLEKTLEFMFDSYAFLKITNLVLVVTSLVSSVYFSNKGNLVGIFMIIAFMLTINIFALFSNSRPIRELAEFMTILYLLCFIIILFFYSVFILFFN